MLMPVVWTNGNMVDWRDPFEEMDREMDQLFHDVTGLDFGSDQMKTDIVEEDHDYKVTSDLPGFDKKDVHVDLKNGVLSVSASHEDSKDEKDEKTGRYLRRERRASSYQRSFHVGRDVKPEDISAKYENGVLTLTIPKKETADQKEDVKQIEVK